MLAEDERAQIRERSLRLPVRQKISSNVDAF